MEAWGVDGCREGWFYFRLDGAAAEFGVVPKLHRLLEKAGLSSPVFVDIPIGLLDGGRSERQCDLDARRALAPRRGSSVFPAPCRAAVYAGSYEEAQRLNRLTLGKGLSKQSWAIAPKIREVDELLVAHPEYQGRVREVHPEICFWGLLGRPMADSKKTRSGFRARLGALGMYLCRAEELVAAAFLEHGDFEAHRDDILDALVAALCASHLPNCMTLPGAPEVDARGLPMEMVYWPAT